jgi:type IV secretory pathway TrbL component
MTTSLCLRTGLALIALSFGAGLGCNSVTGVDDLAIDGAGGAGGDVGKGGHTTGSHTTGHTTGVTTTVGSTGVTTGAGGTSGTGSTSSSSAASSSVASSSSSSAASSSVASSSSSAASSSAASSSAASSSATTGGGTSDPAQLCVDEINAFRATLNLPPYARWTQEEVCASDEAAKDAAANKAHSAFGQCGEWAQNECPGWPGPPGSMIGNCLQMMWDEGPGDFNQGHGHYINMSSTSYTKVACGFHVLASGKVWATQDFK